MKKILMDKKEIKASMLAAIGAEIDVWLEKEPTCKTGYEWETTLVDHARKINAVIIQHSLGQVPINRNKKNSVPL